MRRIRGNVTTEIRGERIHHKRTQRSQRKMGMGFYRKDGKKRKVREPVFALRDYAVVYAMLREATIFFLRKKSGRRCSGRRLRKYCFCPLSE